MKVTRHAEKPHFLVHHALGSANSLGLGPQPPPLQVILQGVDCDATGKHIILITAKDTPQVTEGMDKQSNL